MNHLKQLEEYLKRAFAAFILLAFSLLSAYFGVSILIDFLQHPPHSDWKFYVAFCLMLGGSSLVLYFLLLLAWRAATWTTSRSDGGLLPPPVMYAFITGVCGLWAFSAIQAFRAGEFLSAARLFAALIGGIALIVEIRRRSIRSKKKTNQAERFPRQR